MPSDFIDRRGFLKSALMATATAAIADTTFAAESAAISRITILEVPGEFVRPVAMNAYDKRPVGKSGHIRLVRVFLADGTYGLAVEGYEPIRQPALSFLKSMIGVRPEAVFRWQGERIAGYAPEFAQTMSEKNNCWFELALLDLVGKLRGKPVFELFGDAVRDGIDAYDGSLYFVDVASGRGAEAVGEVAKAIRDDGYRGVKIKVGRPWQWMPDEHGVVRDIEAVIAAREAAGRNMNLMADANNGYEHHHDWAIRFMKETSSSALAWIEEIFPETVSDYTWFHRELQELNADTPVAEGESVRAMDEFRPFLDAGLYRYIQPDMRTCGFSKILYAADLAASARVNVVAHNWMSELGRIACLHASKIRRNIPLVEDDRYHDLALDASQFEFRDGQWFLPKKPGWGVDLSPNYEVFARGNAEIIIT
ncbi:MAG TPA: enolase C-terminal domain-like protein [Acidobacteriaceae bacterium]|nr:enolase C-terminal domain-like protein [Acidobacteriaceae bacterium]